MNIKHGNRVRMYQVIITFLEAAPVAIINTMPGFAQFLTDFKSNVDQINLKSVTKANNPKAITIIKAKSREEAAVLALNMANCLTAFALSAKNQVLEAQMKFTKTDFKKKRDQELAATLNLIRTKATQNAANLVPYGITQVEINQYTTAVENYIKNIPSTRANINTRKELTEQIAALFKNCEEQLRRMDALVEIKKLTNNKFYKNYHLNRKVVKTNTRRLSIRGIVTDENNNPISKVLVSIPTLKLETKTTKKGYFEFKKIPKGIQNLTFTHVNFEETKHHVGITTGYRVQVEINMKEIKRNQDVA